MKIGLEEAAYNERIRRARLQRFGLFLVSPVFLLFVAAVAMGGVVQLVALFAGAAGIGMFAYRIADLLTPDPSDVEADARGVTLGFAGGKSRTVPWTEWARLARLQQVRQTVPQLELRAGYRIVLDVRPRQRFAVSAAVVAGLSAAAGSAGLMADVQPFRVHTVDGWKKFGDETRWIPRVL